MSQFLKRVRVIVSRTGLDAQVKSRSPIGCGGGSGQSAIFATINPGQEVCLDGRLITSFTDAVIDREQHYRVVENGEIVHKTSVEKIPRFHVTEKGYYICDRACKALPAECTGIPISAEEFKRKFSISEFMKNREPEKKTAEQEPVKAKRGRKPRVVQEEAVV